MKKLLVSLLIVGIANSSVFAETELGKNSPDIVALKGSTYLSRTYDGDLKIKFKEIESGEIRAFVTYEKIAFCNGRIMDEDRLDICRANDKENYSLAVRQNSSTKLISFGLLDRCRYKVKRSDGKIVELQAVSQGAVGREAYDNLDRCLWRFWKVVEVKEKKVLRKVLEERVKVQSSYSRFLFLDTSKALIKTTPGYDKEMKKGTMIHIYPDKDEVDGTVHKYFLKRGAKGKLVMETSYGKCVDCGMGQVYGSGFLPSRKIDFDHDGTYDYEVKLKRFPLNPYTYLEMYRLEYK